MWAQDLSFIFSLEVDAWHWFLPRVSWFTLINFYRISIDVDYRYHRTTHSPIYRSNIGVSHVFTIPGFQGGFQVRVTAGRKQGREGGWESHHYFNIVAAHTPHLTLLFDNILDTQKVWSIDSVCQLANWQGRFVEPSVRLHFYLKICHNLTFVTLNSFICQWIYTRFSNQQNCFLQNLLHIWRDQTSWK